MNDTQQNDIQHKSTQLAALSITTTLSLMTLSKISLRIMTECFVDTQHNDMRHNTTLFNDT